MRYTVYCDESRHCECTPNRYMAIGGLWVPREEKETLLRALRESCIKNELRGEVKWHKVSDKRFDAYESFLEPFWTSPGARFRVLILERSRIDYARHHDGDQELGFFKFHYHMLWRWLSGGDQHAILLDKKNNRGKSRYDDLRACLENKVGRAAILGLSPVDSTRSRLAQLCDVLTGAVAAKWCGVDAATAKGRLAQRIGERSRLGDLSRRSVDASFSKFNIFKMDL